MSFDNLLSPRTRLLDALDARTRIESAVASTFSMMIRSARVVTRAGNKGT